MQGTETNVFWPTTFCSSPFLTAPNVVLQADPNMTDMHGSSALLEAVKNGHEETMTLLFQFGADLCMAESKAASLVSAFQAQAKNNLDGHS
jgi:ankyrin repeat protein